MSKANCCISGSSWSYHFVERSNHCLRYIAEGMTEKICRVLGLPLCRPKEVPISPFLSLAPNPSIATAGAINIRHR